MHYTSEVQPIGKKHKQKKVMRSGCTSAEYKPSERMYVYMYARMYGAVQDSSGPSKAMFKMYCALYEYNISVKNTTIIYKPLICQLLRGVVHRLHSYK